MWAPMLLVTVSLAVMITAVHMHSNAASPFDEWVYLDYLFKVPTQGFVHQGEHIGHAALQIASCDGVVLYGKLGDPCGSSRSTYALYPYIGRTGADAYTPIYFWVTYGAGKAVQFITRGDLIESARITSAFWLAGGMIAFYSLLRMFRVNKLVIIAIGLCYIASPVAWWSNSFVSTDAPSFFFGATIFLTAYRFAVGKASGWWLVGFSVLATLVKVTNILAVGLAALFLVFLAVNRARPIDRRWLSPQKWKSPDIRHPLAFGVLSSVSSIVAQLIWLWIRSAESVGSSPDQGIGSPLTLRAIASQLVNFLPETINSGSNMVSLDGSYGYVMPDYLTSPLSWICVAGVIGALMITNHDVTHGAMRWSIAVSSVIFAPILAIGLMQTQGFYFQIPSRYGLSLLPLFLAMFAITMKNRFLAVATLTFGCMLILWTIHYSFTAVHI